MPYDGILIHFLISELSEKLVGGKINKIIEPSSLDLCLQIRSKNQTDNKIKNYQLFISSSLDMPRIYLTDRKISSFESPKNFCMVLRKYLERGIITKIEQIDNDRIIVFHISSISELGDNINYRLIVELMGRNSNIILINSQNIIIDAIRKLPPSEDSKRLILPKATYSYPPSNTTINPFLIDESNQYDIDMLQGVSKLAKDAIKNSHQSLKNYLQHPLNYAIYQIDKKYDFYILPLFNYQIIKDGFDSINMMLDVYYKDYRTIYNDKAKALKKIIKNSIKNKFFDYFLSFFCVFLVILIYFFVNLKLNYGEFRFYILISFCLALSIERIFIGNLLENFLKKCYTKLKRKIKKLYEDKIRKRKNRKLDK